MAHAFKRQRTMGVVFGILLFFGAQARADLIEGVPLRGFTDVSLIHNAADNSDSFQIHDVDFFLAKPIDKKVNFLVELNFQPSTDGVGPDLERAYVQYVLDNWLKVSAGRFHTALGYWNDTFHHGSYLQTSASRPVMTRFEDTGGLLPAHTTGIEFRGNGLVGSGNLGYLFNIGNGRPPVKDPPAYFYNYNKTKSVSGLVYYEFPNGFRFGANFYHSDLPGGLQKKGDGTDDPTRPGPNGSEWIYGAHFVYNSSKIEWLTEFDRMAHTYKNDSHLMVTTLDSAGPIDMGPAQNTNLNLLYTQIGYHIGLFTPYARFELNQTDHPDAYLNADTGNADPGLLDTTRYYTVGTRYEFTASSALKFEVVYVNSGSPIREQLKIPGADPTTTTNWTTNLNWSYGW